MGAGEELAGDVTLARCTCQVGLGRDLAGNKDLGQRSGQLGGKAGNTELVHAGGRTAESVHAGREIVSR